MIFGILKTYKDVKKGTADPTGFGQDILLGVLKAPIIIFTVSGILGLAVFFVLGWTDFLSGPFGFFRVVFWILFIPFFFLEILFWKLYSKAKSLIQKAKNRVDEEVNTIKVEPK
ncbi:MAG: hypothetical protein R3B55_03285 [Candidatus Paceibacterota bacterium]